jgi:hypothetical protein
MGKTTSGSSTAAASTAARWRRQRRRPMKMTEDAASVTLARRAP